MKHYVNKKLKSKNTGTGEKAYPVYIQFIFHRKVYQFKSKLITISLSKNQLDQVLNQPDIFLAKLLEKEKKIVDFIISKCFETTDFDLDKFKLLYNSLNKNILTECTRLLKTIKAKRSHSIKSLSDISIWDLLHEDETIGFSEEEQIKDFEERHPKMDRFDASKTIFMLQQYQLSLEEENSPRALMLVYDWINEGEGYNFEKFMIEKKINKKRLHFLFETINYILGDIERHI